MFLDNGPVAVAGSPASGSFGAAAFARGGAVGGFGVDGCIATLANKYGLYSCVCPLLCRVAYALAWAARVRGGPPSATRL